MKKIKTYIGIMAALLTMLTACSDSMVDNGVPSKNETGTYQAHFTISVPNYSKVESRVANFATEGIESADDMKLLCFDKDGYFLGLAKDLKIDAVGKSDFNDKGGSKQKNITANIPAGTARIHIMANATNSNTVISGSNQAIDFSNAAEWIGRHENNLMTSFENKTNNDPADKMVYWGYVKKATSAEMATFLNGSADSDNIIHLLRNRAKIEVNWEGNTSSITNIRYALGNVKEYGTVAPFNREMTILSFPETNKLTDAAAWKKECTYITPSMNEARWPADGSFSVKETEMWPNSSSLPMQYTFEQENSLEKPLKVIMEVTYKGGETKWFQVLLQNNEGVQIPVKRNHLYLINIKKLGKNLGYSSAELAYNGDPANNPWITVADIIQEISDGNYTMNIVEGTYQILTAESENKIQKAKFTYKGDDKMTAENFDVSWTQNEGFTNPVAGKLPVPTVEYNATTGEGVIKYQVGSIGEDFKKATIMLVDKKHGLTRNIHLYSISNVDFNFPTEITMGKEVTSEAQLTFTIPSYYPKELLPIEIEIASNDVNPIGSDVKVASTTEVDGGKGWNCWFVTKYEDPSVIGDTQTITMKNVRAVTGTEGTFYIKAKHYNGNKPWTVTINYQNQN